MLGPGWFRAQLDKWRTFSMGTPTDWRKSSFCGSSACVEVAELDGAFLVRDSKTEDGPILTFTAEEWSAFVAGVQAGEFAPRR
jgi:hypothetical protein